MANMIYQTFRVPSIAFVGAGKLVEALTKGFVAAGTVQLHQICASAPTPKEIAWVKQLGCVTTIDNVKLVKENQLVVLAVKPQILPKVLKEISDHVTEEHLLISFAAGMKLETMQNLLPSNAKIARLMTNTPVQFCEGVSSFTLGKNCTRDDRSTIMGMMKAVGYCEEVKEDALDTVTGFAGGGPAFTYCFIEAMADAAVLGGIDRNEAIKMAAKTVLGAAKMVMETKKHPGELKDEVCSAGGSTIFGIQAMENSGMRASVINSVRQASDRSKELGQIINKSAEKQD